MRPIFALSLTLLAASACREGSADAPRPPAASVAAYEVRAETLTTVVPVQGTVAARQRAEISTRLMARVVDVPVELGARVRTGQALIRLGVEDIAASRAKAAAAVTVARAARDEAQRQAARMDTLYAQDAVALVQRDQTRLAATQAESQLAMAEATLEEVATAAGYSRIPAPFDGVVVARNVDPGDLAAPGQPLLALESVGPRDAILSVPADVGASLEVGATLTVTALDGRTGQARIRAVAGGADPMTRTVEVRAALAADWPTGISVTALVPAGTCVGIASPTHAVVRRGQLTGVRIVSGDLTTLRWVRLGRTVGDRIEVLSGLEAGERIAP
jgi:RND family efflux transporter MFP subunit